MSVAIVGAGPGDPGLITVRGLELVEAAEVLVYDRLVAPELVAKATGAELIARDELTQRQVNEVLVREGARGVARAHDHDRARPRCERGFERRDVEMPFAVVRERVAAQLDRLELCEELEERIARARHEHLVAGVAEQLEQERVRLAGARVRQDALRCRPAPRRAKIAGDGGPRGLETEGRGIAAVGPPSR